MRRLAVRAGEPPGALLRVVAGQPGGHGDHLLGRDARRGGRAVRAGPGGDRGAAQRDRPAALAGATRRRWRRPGPGTPPAASPLLVYFGRLEYREGRPGPDRRAAPHPARPPRRPAAGRRHRLGRRRSWSAPPASTGCGAACGSSAGSRTTSCRPCSPRPTRSCCPAATSRSASSRWRRRPPAPRWSRRRRAGWARWCGTARPGCRSGPATWPAWPPRWAGCWTTPTARAAGRSPGRRRLATDFDWTRIAAATAAVYLAARAGGPVELGRPKIPTGNAFGRAPR